MLKVGCISIGFPNFRYDIAEENLHKTLGFLKKQEIELIANEKVLITEEDIAAAFDKLSGQNIDVLILELGTYSYGSALMMYLEKIKGAHLVMWGFREPIIEGFTGMPLNSMCALNMYTSFLYRMQKHDFSYVYGEAEEAAALEKITKILEAAKIKKELKESKFCIIGGRVPGFYLSNVDELKFRNEIGAELVYYSIASLIDDANKVPMEEVEVEKINFLGMVSKCTASAQSLEKSARIYIAIKKFAKENKVNGFALKCWPDFQDLMDVAVCGIVARLNQEGLLTSCEGDVTGLTTMFIQSRISSQPVFLTDLVNITQEGTVKLWHCGSAAPALAADKENTSFCTHPTMKYVSGMATEFPLQQGKVMLCKLTEDKQYKFLALEGTCVEPDRELCGNQGDVRFDFSTDQLMELIVKEGIEHHYCIAYDCDMAVVKCLCDMMDMKLLTLN